MYNHTVQGIITHWLTQVEQLAGLAETFIVYCITAEVRAKRPKGAGLMRSVGILEQVEELMAKDFKEKAKKWVCLSVCLSVCPSVCLHCLLVPILQYYRTKIGLIR